MRTILRQLTNLILGLVLVVDCIVANFNVVQFTVGMILLGLVPVEAIADAIGAHCHPYRPEGGQ